MYRYYTTAHRIWQYFDIYFKNSSFLFVACSMPFGSLQPHIFIGAIDGDVSQHVVNILVSRIVARNYVFLPLNRIFSL